MQIVAPIGISDQTRKLFQVFKDGFLMATLNADDNNEARKTCAQQYNVSNLWYRFQTVEILRS